MNQNGESLADRMKSYEPKVTVLARVPKVIRLDGRAFGTYLKNIKGEFNSFVKQAFVDAAIRLMEDIGGTARVAYLQSDECSIALNDFLDINTQAWFGNNIVKMCSVSSSIFTRHFNLQSPVKDSHAYFDARLVPLPSVSELNNYFVWRQQDGIRNSINKFARQHYSHKEVEGRTCVEILEALKLKGSPWENLLPWEQRGVCIERDVDGKFKVNQNIPIFSKAPEYIARQFHSSNPSPTT